LGLRRGASLERDVVEPGVVGLSEFPLGLSGLLSGFGRGIVVELACDSVGEVVRQAHARHGLEAPRERGGPRVARRAAGGGQGAPG
jgi:hypothetical protein